MSADFYDFVRGRTDQVPAGYQGRGLRVYRYLVYLGVSQMIEASWPQLREKLGEEAWKLLLEDFVRQSQWTSHFYGDLEHEFRAYLARTLADPSA